MIYVVEQESDWLVRRRLGGTVLAGGKKLRRLFAKWQFICQFPVLSAEMDKCTPEWKKEALHNGKGSTSEWKRKAFHGFGERIKKFSWSIWVNQADTGQPTM